MAAISIESWIILGGVAVIAALLVILLLRGGDKGEVETLKAERDEWRAKAQTAADDHAIAREKVARLESAAEERDRLRQELRQLEQEKDTLAERFAALRAELDAARTHHEEKLSDLKMAREELSETFQLTANKVLKTSGEELTKKGSESLQGLLGPLKEQLESLQKKVNEDAEKRAGHAGQLQSLVETVRKDAERMSEDAKNLANALRSSSKMQGDWGEMILSGILERAGLREGVEFHTQTTERDDDGRGLRPDVVVEMPNGHRLVIDSKVSLVAFEEGVNAEDEEARAGAVKRHIASVRAHIKSLGEKDYAQFYEGVSFTLMFVPLEGAASLALQNDPDLTAFAAERDVMIATPTTLMMAMRTVQNLWMIERQNQNARDIAERAGRLYDKFEGFVGDLDRIGSRIDQAKDSWHDARKKLVEGSGNVIRQTEMLKSLGAKTKKSLPQDYLDEAGVDEVGADTPEAAALPAPDGETEPADS